MMLSSQSFSHPMDDLPEEEGPLGLFFSSPAQHVERSSINLHLSSPLLSDSLFLKHLSVTPAEDALFRDAKIYFPETEVEIQDTLHWQIDRPVKTFTQFCEEQSANPDTALLESIVLQLCEMVHVLHSNAQANMPLTPQMLRIQENGAPMLLVLPLESPQTYSTPVRNAIFPPLFSAPEVQAESVMAPQAYTYNIAVLAAMLFGFVPNEQESLEASLHDLQTWINEMPESSMKLALQRSLQADMDARPYCPMKLHKALCGHAPHECTNCKAHQED